MIIITKAVRRDAEAAARLAMLLWPDHTPEELEEEMRGLISSSDCAVFLAQECGFPVGFLQCQLRRDYVEGSASSPVAYLEGVYVREEYRRRKIAARLLRSAEDWALEQGCGEMGSDCAIDNAESPPFHLGMGFAEAGRVICFIKQIEKPALRPMETRRLLLRPFCMDDADRLYAYASNPNVGPNAGWKPHENRAQSEEILREFIERREVFAIVNAEENRLIGSIGLHADSKRKLEGAKTIGYVLDEAYWGHGYATEAACAVLRYAFEEAGAEIVSVYVYSFNERSKRVAEKCGLRCEGTLRRAGRLYDGRVTDHVCYSITREEY